MSMTFDLGVQILYILAFLSMTGFVTVLLYPDTNIWERDIIIIMLLVLLIDFIWLTTYLLSL